MYSGILGWHLHICHALMILPNMRLNTYMITSINYLGKLDSCTTHIAAQLTQLHAVAPMLHLCAASAKAAGNDVSLYMLGCLLLSCIRSCSKSCLLLLSSTS